MNTSSFRAVLSGNQLWQAAMGGVVTRTRACRAFVVALGTTVRAAGIKCNIVRVSIFVQAGLVGKRRSAPQERKVQTAKSSGSVR